MRSRPGAQAELAVSHAVTADGHLGGRGAALHCFQRRALSIPLHRRTSRERHAGDHIRGIPVTGASIVRENHTVGAAAQIRHVHTVCPGFRAPVIRGEPCHGNARPRCVGCCGCGTIILVNIGVDGVPPRGLGRIHHGCAGCLTGTARAGATCAGTAARIVRLIVGADRIGFRGAGGDLAAGDGDSAAVDLVGVGAVVKGGVRTG